MLHNFELMKLDVASYWCYRTLSTTISHLNGTVTMANVVKNGAQGYSQCDIDC